MITKTSHPIDLLSQAELSPLIRVYYQLNQLKQLYRQGWLQRGIPPERCESVADHVFSMAALALLCWRLYAPELDLARVLEMTLLHELGEIFAGDITPAHQVPDEEKHRREAESVVRVLAGLPDGEHYRRVWLEFEQGASPEARFVRQMDKLEMGLQAGVYRRMGLADLGGFLPSARRALEDERLVRLLEESWPEGTYPPGPLS